jgi:hypothetical protein
MFNPWGKRYEMLLRMGICSPADLACSAALEWDNVRLGKRPGLRHFLLLAEWMVDELTSATPQEGNLFTVNPTTVVFWHHWFQSCQLPTGHLVVVTDLVAALAALQHGFLWAAQDYEAGKPMLPDEVCQLRDLCLSISKACSASHHGEHRRSPCFLAA